VFLPHGDSTLDRYSRQIIRETQGVGRNESARGLFFFSLFSFTIFLFAHLPRTFLAVHCTEKLRDFINVTAGFTYNWTLGS
jgi:hypothetical protein